MTLDTCISACHEKDQLGIKQGWCWACVQELRRKWREEEQEHTSDIIQLAREVTALRAQRDLLRAALVRFVGTDGREELEQMELMFRSIPAPSEDKAASIDAIRALLEMIDQK